MYYSAVSVGKLDRIASLLAEFLEVGDAVLLKGDLGAGKTTFARTLIRQMLSDNSREIPSPTYTIVEPYEVNEHTSLWHCDLYRLNDASDLDELGFNDACVECITVIEWPEIIPKAMLSKNRIEFHFTPGSMPETRNIQIKPYGRFTALALPKNL